MKIQFWFFSLKEMIEHLISYERPQAFKGGKAWQSQ